MEQKTAFLIKKAALFIPIIVPKRINIERISGIDFLSVFATKITIGKAKTTVTTEPFNHQAIPNNVVLKIINGIIR